MGGTDVTEESLVAALVEDPFDDDARAVLADWLEERGRGQDAELVRAFVERRAMHAGDPDVVACSERLRGLAASSTWSDRDAVVADPTLRATTRHYVSRPWIRFEPLRLGKVPSGLGTPNVYVCVESYVADLLRVDVYGREPHEATVWQGRVFVGYGHWAACVEPYGRGVSLIDLESAFGHFHREEDVLLVVSSERIARLAPGGEVLWRSEVVGDTRIESVAIAGDGGRAVTGVGVSSSWETRLDERRPFTLDLETGALL